MIEVTMTRLDGTVFPVPLGRIEGLLVSKQSSPTVDLCYTDGSAETVVGTLLEVCAKIMQAAQQSLEGPR